MANITAAEWRELLSILLAQRLELNALESVLRSSSILTAAQIKDIRTQAADTAKAWSSREDDDVLKLLRIHSLPQASMTLQPPEEDGR